MTQKLNQSSSAEEEASGEDDADKKKGGPNSKGRISMDKRAKANNIAYISPKERADICS